MIPERVNEKAFLEDQLRQKFLITLAEEVRTKQLPHSRYADVIKKAKVPYTGSFAEVALSAKENQIGTISRMVMKTISLENEIDFIPESEKKAYLDKAIRHFRPLAAKQNLFDKWLGDAQQDPDYHQKMLLVTTELYQGVQKIASFGSSNLETDEKLQVIKNFHHSLVGVLGNELQVAVDGPKSALRPEQDILKTIESLTKYRDVIWLEDYKSPNLYLTEAMRTSTYSPIDRLARQVNENWSAVQLQARKTVQFRPLFADVPYTEAIEAKVKQVRTEHNRLNNVAHSIKNEQENYPGPRMTLVSPSGRTLEVVGLSQSKHPDVFASPQFKIEVRLDPKSELKYAVFAEIPGQLNELNQISKTRLGYLSHFCESEHGPLIEQLMKNNDQANLGTLSVEAISTGLTKDDVKAYFNQVRAYDESVREQIEPSELESCAAAMWSLTHTRTDGTQASKDSDFRTASVAFGIFAPEIQSRLEQLQFKELTVSGVRLNECQNRSFNQERLPISIEFSTDTNQRLVKVDGQVLGSFARESPQLPTGTTALASVTTVKGSGVDALTSDGQTLRVGVLKNYPYAETDFQSIKADLTFQTLKNQHNRLVVVARFEKQILGEIKDVDSKNYLKYSGYIDTGKPLNVTITRDAPSVATVVVDPDTVVYPHVQVHDQARKNLSKPSLLEEPNPLLPTLWSQSEAGLNLAVDNRNTENLMGFFERFSVPVTQVQDAFTEKELGYAVVRFDSLPESVYTKLQDKFGEPLSTENYQAALQKQNSDVVTVIDKELPVIQNEDHKIASQSDPEQLQIERSHEIIPIVLDYLKAKGKSFVQGETHTAFWDASNQTLHLIDNAKSEPKMTAKYSGKNQQGQPIWDIIPHTEQENEKLNPRLSEQDVKHFEAQKPKIDAILQGQKAQSKGKTL
jgi:hypothetical protein